MSMALTYNDDLSRVQIALSDLGVADGTLLVERSTNQLLWETVRGGAALPVSGGSAALDDYEFHTDVENHYRVQGESVLRIVDVPSTRAITDDSASLSITGDIDIRVKCALDNWDTGSVQRFAAKWSAAGDQRSWLFHVAASGALQIGFSSDGTSGATLFRSSSVIPDFEDGSIHWVRVTMDVDNGSGGHTVRFFTSDDGVSWTQLGSDVVNSGTASIFNSTTGVSIGSTTVGAERAVGDFHRVEIYDGIDGDLVADPDFRGEAPGTTEFDDDQGNTWTLQGDAEIIPGVLALGSITPDLNGRIWLKSIRHPFLNRAVTVTEHHEVSRHRRGVSLPVTGRSLPVAVSDVRGSRGFPLEVMTETLEQARDMDLVLASGDVFFVHVPADCPVPGGYVTVDTTTEFRRSTRGLRRYFLLPCTVVAPPSPEVVGTTLTWGTVRALYGSWEAVRNSNPTWGDLLDLVGSPDDLVVI